MVDVLYKKLYTRFLNKVRKAEKAFDDGGIYICPVCDGKSRMCDDDYQSLECETIERDILGGDYYENQETN
tara:strand:- start:312 stop:524 length:213 start_codon:yes stop_codon:yes gene_type:complete